jgi:hypothetical protein
MNGIVWLASYPKSGNTWTRVFLTNYLRNADAPADINALDGEPIASARLTFEEFVGVESSDLTPAQIETLRPHVYRIMAAEARRTLFLKVHDAYTCNPNGEPLFPADATQNVIYILRHPCDVAISYAHHNSQTPDKAVALMNDPTHKLSGRENTLDIQLQQKLLAWSGHVCSWLESGLSVHVVRYEDMLAQPVETFGAAIRFLELEYDAERLERAIEFSRFEELQAQEAKNNFQERAPRAPNFFRQGKAGAWRESLSAEQVAAIVSAHADVMRRFGYLDAKGNVL